MNALLTELDLQFIEVAARCFWDSLPPPEHWKNNTDGWRVLHANTAPSHESRDIAASLHGRLLERNGVRSIDEIVTALEDSERSQRFPNGFTLDTAAFFRAVAIEAMGGAKVSETFAVALQIHTPVVKRVFTNELRNQIYITIEGPSSTSENVITPHEATELRSALDEYSNLREQLASLAHEQWSGWMSYMLGDCDSSTCRAVAGLDAEIPRPRIEHREYRQRWTRQMATPYAELPDDEKESDRKEADRVIAVISRSHPFSVPRLTEGATI